MSERVPIEGVLGGDGRVQLGAGAVLCLHLFETSAPVRGAVLYNKALDVLGRDARRVREVHREAIASIEQLGIEAVHVDVFLVRGST